MRQHDAAYEVHKYGGSSLADAEGFMRVATALSRRSALTRVVVLSAPQGVTDRLLGIFECATKRRSLLPAETALLKSHVVGLAASLSLSSAVIDRLDVDFRALEEAARDGADPQSWICMGEYWSQLFMAEILDARRLDAASLDACDLIAVHRRQARIRVDQARSQSRTTALFARQSAPRILVPGFAAVDQNGERCTLGRNGSDYTAALLAAYLDARQLVIWSDTDGLLTVDPDHYPRWRPVPQVSFDVLEQLAAIGCGVVHPRTVRPVRERQIPLQLKNSFRPQVAGTRVLSGTDHCEPVISCRGGLTAIRGRHRRASRLAALVGCELERRGRRLWLRETSKQGFLLVIDETDVALVTTEVIRRVEQRLGESSLFSVSSNLVLLQVVGEELGRDPNARRQIESELDGLNLSVQSILVRNHLFAALIGGGTAGEILARVHHRLVERADGLSLMVLGSGPVAAGLMESLDLARSPMPDSMFRVEALTDGTTGLLDAAGIAPSLCEQRLNQDGGPNSLRSLMRDHQALPGRHKVVVDAGWQASVADYVEWLALGYDVVTANHRALAGPIADFESLQQAQERHGGLVLCEAAVNGSVWAIERIRHLIQAGESITGVRGILCGFQSWFWAQIRAGRRASDAIAEAVELGIADSDPSNELSGTDSACRWIILGRACGFQCEHARCEVETPLGDGPWTTDGRAWAGIDLDRSVAERLKRFARLGRSPAFVGELSQNGTVKLGIAALEQDHFALRLGMGDLYLEVYTDRLGTKPLIFAGPGLAGDASARGLVSDLAKLAERRGLVDLRPQWIGPAGVCAAHDNFT